MNAQNPVVMVPRDLLAGLDWHPDDAGCWHPADQSVA